MGHATRSIPLIRVLVEEGHEVILASDGRSYHLLEEEFPSLKIVQLPSYHIRYFSNNMVWNMALQLPRIAIAVFREHFYIKKLIQKENINFIISDNRFGCFHPQIPSYIISHQLTIPIDNAMASILGNAANRFWLRRFDECWIPDVGDKPNISGILSHPAPSSLKVKYLGALTRMKQIKTPKKYQVIAVLSGPEPQRSLLEEKIYQQVQNIEGEIVIVQGKTELGKKVEKQGNITTISYLSSHELNRYICESEVLISRSGYSTLMDLSALDIAAILVPTPGQTEQEYLAQHFHEQGIYLMQKQDELDIPKGLKELNTIQAKPNNFQKDLRAFLKRYF